jgi:hypothetical protein
LTNTGDLTVNGNGTITGTLGVTALATTNGGLTNNGTLTNNGNATITGTLAVTGATTITGTLTVTNLDASKVVFTDGSKGLTSSGTVSVVQGGTGNTGTLTGVIRANLTGAYTAAVEGVDYSLVREYSDESINISSTTTSSETIKTAGTTDFLLTNTPSSKSVLKLYINGVRISKNAISNSGTTVYYIASQNANYLIKSGDRVQIDYFY